MEGQKMDDTLKAYFSRHRHVPEKGVNCPPAETLGEYASGMLAAAELYSVSSHVKGCESCNELVEGAFLYSTYGRQIKLPDVPENIKNKVKALHPAYKAKEHRAVAYFKRNIWIALSLVSLTASFFLPRYFMQFLIPSLIFGFKWVFNRESTRTLIMIYNAWKKHDTSSDKELEEIFRSRI